ncbi:MULTISPECIES: HD domain-containing protein [unclassified Solwaraspora]|uniref:HD domain-containing protein n=1 Tax=unclassified Solwaraspora TaxID=2627926 RepID=UPI00259B5F9A|nr:HD domain-containing protein [Solwaraspora sp. WMMA2056]WJK40748.1 phosphohydrolase [Solwaraspora sp. WMMA2056]
MPLTLRHALDDPPLRPLRPLPAPVGDLLLRLDAPPRLAAHLRAVHDVAAQLTGWLAVHYPALAVDRDAVLFGAATHDIGKTVHVAELSGPGSRHEPAGQQILLDAGIGPYLARFAATHASWQSPGIECEDLLVSLADKIWKAKRVVDLEQLVVDRLAAASGQEPWQAFVNLDDHLDGIAADADQRLAFQNSYPITDG